MSNEKKPGEPDQPGERGDTMDVVEHNQPSEFDPTATKTQQHREPEGGNVSPGTSSTGGVSADVNTPQPGGAAPSIESGRTTSIESQNEKT